VFAGGAEAGEKLPLRVFDHATNHFHHDE
jgi:hypothetical protein